MGLETNLSKYKEFDNFKYLNTPQSFDSLFSDKDFPIIQLYDGTIISAGKTSIPVGFTGSFSWIDNKIIPLDGDSYDEKMVVLAIREWEKDEEKIMDILVEGDW